MDRNRVISQVLLLLSWYLLPILCMGSNLVGTSFYSYGISKNEKITFVNDSICIYKQEWDSCVLVERPYHYADTFLYYRCGIIDNEDYTIEKIVIKNNHLPLIQKPLAVPIDKVLYQQMYFDIPKVAMFFDISSRNIIIGEMRRSRYYMWDMPSYRGKKNKIANAYAVLFNIDSDTLFIYDNKIVRFNSTNILLYSPESYKEDKGGVFSTLMAQEMNSYEYQKYCYSNGFIESPFLSKDNLIGHRFYCSNMDDKEESLFFINDSCCEFLQNNEHPATINYSIKNNLIILHIPDKSGSNCFIADTLAYNGGFIFYSKVCHLEDQYTELQIRCFHERKGIVKKSKHIRRWVTTNEEQARHKSYDYPEYAFFNHICHNTYIPINW